jgi:UDP:flavonoid glycosyltransferase YjiC (YdhE family)
VFDPVLLPTSTAPPPGMPSLGPLNRVAWSMLDRMLASTGRPLDDLLERAGSAQRRLPLFRARSPLLHLVACSPSIIRVPPDLPATTRVTGAWLDRSTPAPLPPLVETFLADDRPPIVIAFGSMAGVHDEVMTRAVSTMLESGRRVVLQGSSASSVSSPNLLRIGHVDHRALFGRAGPVIHHGGAGTTHAACAAGAPSVVVPHVGDQRYWAERLERLGVAPAPQPVRSLHAHTLAQAALATAADHEMRATAGRLGDRIGAEDGVAAAVSLLEAIA